MFAESGNEISLSNRRSLRRVAEARDDLPLHNAALHELLSDIMKYKHSWPFIRPVQKNEVEIHIIFFLETFKYI